MRTFSNHAASSQPPEGRSACGLRFYLPCPNPAALATHGSQSLRSSLVPVLAISAPCSPLRGLPLNKTGCHANTVLYLKPRCPRASQGRRLQALCRPHPQNGRPPSGKPAAVRPLPKGKSITKSDCSTHHREQWPLYCLWRFGKTILKVRIGVFSWRGEGNGSRRFFNKLIVNEKIA
ncbi:hypothetical protein Xszus_04232 [Xenorhabdus szentirmaii]|nr:hypothetical protein Xszus_04232 [Xenorhabdus szentirmaii]